MAPTYLTGFGCFHPEEIITNATLMQRVDTSEEWILSRTGIRERRRAPADMNTSGLAAKATAAALEDGGWSGQQVELLICATSTPDMLIPGTASFICQQLKIDPVAFDINAACSGFVYGMVVADAMIKSQKLDKVVMVTAEKYTRVTNYDDRASCIFFGDSAGAVLMSPTRPAWGMELLDFDMRNYNEGAHMVTTEIGGYFRQDGAAVKNYALRAFHESATFMLEKHGLEPDDLRAFVGHQANLRVLQTVADTLNVHEKQHWHNVELFGNQGAAGAASTLTSRVVAQRQDFQDGDLFLCTVFGSGFTCGSALMRWVGEAPVPAENPA
ncbi:MAG: ketoacyl-ACP synthase III [Planctomycetota bacterium]|nr:MAG: ketoacyl-ACP synthase III [Planctomycetota bacterium]